MSIILQLRARHFVNTDFSATSECAIAKAAKEQLQAKEVSVSTTYVYINNKAMYKADYGYAQFNEDKKAALAVKDPEDVVRGVRLIEM